MDVITASCFSYAYFLSNNAHEWISCAFDDAYRYQGFDFGLDEEGQGVTDLFLDGEDGMPFPGLLLN